MAKRTKTRAPVGAKAGGALMLALYAAANLIVGACICALLVRFTAETEYFAESALIYAVFSLVLSFAVGIGADKLQRTGVPAAVGCAIMAASVIAAQAPFVLAALLGIGGACFYIGGGAYALRRGADAKAPAIFICSRAVGVCAGGIIANLANVGGTALLISSAASMAAIAALIVLCEPLSFTYESVAPFPHGITVSYPAREFLAVVCFFIVNAICTFAIASTDYGPEGGLTAPILIAAAISAGQLAGGLLCGRTGPRALSAVALTGAAALFIFGENIYAYAAAICLYNITTPLLLRASSDNMKPHGALALAVLALSSFAGYLPASLGVNMPLGAYGYSASAVVCMALAAAGFELSRSPTRKRS